MTPGDDEELGGMLTPGNWSGYELFETVFVVLEWDCDSDRLPS